MNNEDEADDEDYFEEDDDSEANYWDDDPDVDYLFRSYARQKRQGKGPSTCSGYLGPH